VKYGDLRAGMLFLYRHNPAMAQRLVAFIEPLMLLYRRRGVLKRANIWNNEIPVNSCKISDFKCPGINTKNK
jgi:hypothetical protein